jgi:hypothetical protein
MARTRPAVLRSLGVALATTACLVEPNPDFLGAGTDETESTGPPGTCPEGTLDCDGEPGCEADADDPLTCGSCSKSCEWQDELLSCVEQQCTGTVVFTDLPDTYVDGDQPEQNFGSDPILVMDVASDSYIELPSIEAVPTGATIETLALYLTCVSEPGASLDVYRVETSWDEQQLTGSSAPGLDKALVASVAIELGHNIIDLVDLLPSWRMGNPKRSLAFGPDLDAGPDPIATECSSREGAAPPFLLLTMRW